MFLAFFEYDHSERAIKGWKERVQIEVVKIHKNEWNIVNFLRNQLQLSFKIHFTQKNWIMFMQNYKIWYAILIKFYQWWKKY